MMCEQSTGLGLTEPQPGTGGREMGNHPLIPRLPDYMTESNIFVAT